MEQGRALPVGEHAQVAPSFTAQAGMDHSSCQAGLPCCTPQCSPQAVMASISAGAHRAPPAARSSTSSPCCRSASPNGCRVRSQSSVARAGQAGYTSAAHLMQPCNPSCRGYPPPRYPLILPTPTSPSPSPQPKDGAVVAQAHTRLALPALTGHIERVDVQHTRDVVAGDAHFAARRHAISSAPRPARPAVALLRLERRQGRRHHCRWCGRLLGQLAQQQGCKALLGRGRLGMVRQWGRLLLLLLLRRVQQGGQ